MSAIPAIPPKILTQRSVETAKPRAERYGRPDGLVPGLRLLVQPTGVKSYTLVSRINGKTVNLKVGSPAVISLADARAKAKALLADIAAGKDPRAAKQEQSPATTFEAVVHDYTERHLKVHTRSWRHILQMFKHDPLPCWRDRQLDSIAKSDVIALLDAIMDRGSPGTANHVHASLRGFFNWCVTRGLLTTAPTDRVKMPAPKNARDRFHTDAELMLIWKAAAMLGYPGGPAIQMLILTGQRRSEVCKMTWSELDPGLENWVLPATRVKNGHAHHVPIVPAVRELLLGLPRIAGTDLVFAQTKWVDAPTAVKPNNYQLDLNTMVTHANGGVPLLPWVFHDFRRSFASGAAKLGVRLEVVEKVLNHVSGSFGGVAGIYQRHDFAEEKRAALTLWSEHVLALSARS